MTVFTILNIIVIGLIGLCYFYQIVYIFISYLAKKKSPEAKKINRIAVMISARNEENVIQGLIACLKAQDYPQDMLDVFVVADNCTDTTADAARGAGAIVYERFNKVEVGKGFAIDFLLKKIAEDYGKDTYYSFLDLVVGFQYQV